MLLARESRLPRVDDVFLDWFLQNSEPRLPAVPITLVEIGREDFRQMSPLEGKKPLPKGEAGRRSLSPLEYALFIQAVLNFQPAVVGFEPIVIWRERDKDQEQVFIDQAMRVPKLLVAMRLGEKSARDLAAEDVPVFTQVTGARGGLAEFSGISQRPDDDIRLISTPGFINLPGDRTDRIRVPLLFQYRGEIVPSFPLQAIMLWLRITPAAVKVELGRQISLPNGWRIPLHRDGTITVNPVAAGSVRRLTLNQLLLAAQEHDLKRPPTIDLSGLKDQIVLFRVSGDPLQPPNIFSTAIATIQSNAYVRRAPVIYDWAIILAAGLLSFLAWRFSKGSFLLGAIALTAGWSLLELGLLSQARLWLPLLLPLVLLWITVLVRLFLPNSAPEAKAQRIFSEKSASLPRA
ncbi:MAG: CHASE2 domain-containing protein [Chthoniobacterales bacterium]